MERYYNHNLRILLYYFLHKEIIDLWRQPKLREGDPIHPNPDVNHREHLADWSPLVYALNVNQPSRAVVKTILETGVIDGNHAQNPQRGGYDEPPVMIAVRRNLPRILQELIQHGAVLGDQDPSGDVFKTDELPPNVVRTSKEIRDILKRALLNSTTLKRSVLERSNARTLRRKVVEKLPNLSHAARHSISSYLGGSRNARGTKYRRKKRRKICRVTRGKKQKSKRKKH